MDSDDPASWSDAEPPVDDGAEVFDFLDAYYEDLEAGETHELSHYLRRFPGREEAISREFLTQKEIERVGSAPGRPAQILEPQDSKVGPYELVAEIGRGGQGVVYLAEDSRIARRVALKVLPPAALLLSQDRRHRLRREAEVISRLDHPGICGIFDAEIGEELAYIAMPFVEGCTLSSLIVEARDEKTPVSGAVPVAPKTEAELFALLEFFEQAARALHSAHEVGIVHRDIKPGNLMVTPDGRPVWLDFGQARDVESSMIDLTLSGEIFGTPAYMSPEQVSGGTVTARTDIWALGVSLFEALTLKRPFEGASAHSLLLAIQSDVPLRARDLNSIVGEELSVVLETTLERDLTRRYRSAAAFADELARIRRREPIQARPAGVGLRMRRWVQRHPVLFLAIMSMALGLIVSTNLLMRGNRALRHALGRHLAERSEAILEEDPASALVLGIEAAEHASNYLTRSALFDALERCQLRAVYQTDGTIEDPKLLMDLEIVSDQKHVVAARFDGTVCLFDLYSGERVGLWKAHGRKGWDTRMARVVTCSASGRVIASGGDDGTVFLHDLDGVREDVLIDVDSGAITELAFGADDACLAVRSAEGGVALFDVNNGKRMTQFATSDESPSRLAFDATSACFVELPRSGQSLERLRIWRGSDGNLLSEARTDSPIAWAATGAGRLVFIDEVDRAHVRGLTSGEMRTASPRSLGGKVQNATLSKDGRQLFLSLEIEFGEVCRLIDVETGDSRELTPPSDEPVLEAGFSPLGDRLAVRRRDQVLRVWDVREGYVLSECRGYLSPTFRAWTADGVSILTGGMNTPEAHLWYGAQPPDVFRLRCGDSPVVHVEISESGRQLLTRDGRGLVRLWTGEGVLEKQLPGTWSGAGFISGFADVLTWGSAGARTWNLNQQGCTLTSALEESSPDYKESNSLSSDPIRSARSHPGGSEYLLVHEAGGSELVKLRESVQHQALGEYDDILLAEYSPDGEVIVTAHAEGQLRFWSSESATELHNIAQLDGKGQPVSPIALTFDRDSLVVALARSDRTVHFFWLDGTKTEPVPLQSLMVFDPRTIEWASDNRHFLVTGTGGRGAVRVYDLYPPDPKDAVMRVENFHADDITGGCFSADGQLALSTSLDGTVMIRDVSGAEESRATKLIAQIRGRRGPALSAAFGFVPGTEDLRVIVGFADGTAGVWPVDPLPPAKARRPRDLAAWEIAREQRLAQPLEYR